MNANSSAYIRVPFSVPNLAAVDQLLLDMQYDAGFVAYLNGQEVARRNAPTAAGVPPAFNAAATAERSNSEALAAETIDLTQFKNLLTPRREQRAGDSRPEQRGRRRGFPDRARAARRSASAARRCGTSKRRRRARRTAPA